MSFNPTIYSNACIKFKEILRFNLGERIIFNFFHIRESGSHMPFLYIALEDF